MTFKKKLENFWYHHKFGTLITVFILIAAIILAVDVFNKTEYDLAVAYVGPDYADHITFKPIQPEVEKVAGDIDGNGETNVRFAAIVMPDVPQNEMDLAKEQPFNYTFLDSTVRVYLCEKKYFESKSLFFMPLEDILPAERLENGVLRDGKCVAVPLKGNTTLENLGISTENLYIGVRAQTYEDKKDEFIAGREESSIEVMKYFINQL